MFELVAHLGTSYVMAERISNLLMTGMSVGAVIGMVSGIGSWAGVFLNMAKYMLKSQSKRVVIGF